MCEEVLLLTENLFSTPLHLDLNSPFLNAVPARTPFLPRFMMTSPTSPCLTLSTLSSARNPSTTSSRPTSNGGTSTALLQGKEISSRRGVRPVLEARQRTRQIAREGTTTGRGKEMAETLAFSRLSFPFIPTDRWERREEQGEGWNRRGRGQQAGHCRDNRSRRRRQRYSLCRAI